MTNDERVQICARLAQIEREYECVAGESLKMANQSTAPELIAWYIHQAEIARGQGAAVGRVLEMISIFNMEGSH